MEDFRRLGWTEAELVSHRKSAAGKWALAARLRRETTLPLKWIAARLGLSPSKSANRRLQFWMKEDQKPAPAAATGSEETGRTRRAPNYGLTLC